MTIWKRPFTLEILNQTSENTMVGHLGIKYSEIGDDYLSATMPATERTRQPYGIIHGGANVVLAESLASVAANFSLENPNERAVGLEINANHLRMVPDGVVTGTTRPLHLGRKNSVWEIKIVNEAGKLTCICRMTAAIIIPQTIF